MAILANADHLEVLSEASPELRQALERVALAPEHQRQLAMILGDLAPIARDLMTATRAICDLVDRLSDG